MEIWPDSSMPTMNLVQKILKDTFTKDSSAEKWFIMTMCVQFHNFTTYDGCFFFLHNLSEYDVWKDLPLGNLFDECLWCSFLTISTTVSEKPISWCNWPGCRLLGDGLLCKDGELPLLINLPLITHLLINTLYTWCWDFFDENLHNQKGEGAGAVLRCYHTKVSSNRARPPAPSSKWEPNKTLI